MSARRPRVSGFVLLPVLLLIAVLATVTLLLAEENASNLSASDRETEAHRASLVAEAGLRHAAWLASAYGSCKDYTDLEDVAFGDDAYSVSFTSDSGSPVSLSAVSVLSNGATSRLDKRQTLVYQSATTSIWQPGPSGLDTYLRDGANDSNNFGAASLLGIDNVGAEQVSLLRFDLSALPANASLKSAVLELWLEGGDNLDNAVIDAHRVAQAWVEGELDGDAPVPGDGATYMSYNGQTNWASAGGDYDPTPVATTTIPALASGWYSWDVTALASEWIAGTVANDGLLLRASGGIADMIAFTSSDGTDSHRPRLRITARCECGNTACGGSPPKDLLFVVGNALSLTTEEVAHRTLIEGWGYTVDLIDDNALSLLFDVAVANSDVVFTTNDIVASSLGTKLLDADIGVVTSEVNLSDDFGLASAVAWDSGTALEINDNGHYITSPFALGSLSVLSTNESLAYVTGTLAPGLEQLASSTSGFGVVAVEAGAPLYGGGTAAGRRVQLPWGGAGFDPTSLTLDGMTLLQRALEWAAGAGDAPPTGPLAHWKLDDGSGLTAIDSEGGHDGTLSGGPVWVMGQDGGALSFDGVDDYVDLTSDAELDDVFVGGATFTAWIHPAGWGEGGYGRIIDKSNSAASTGDGWLLRMNVDNGGIVNFGHGFGGGRGWWKIPDGSITLNAWQHIAITYDAVSAANDPQIYLDGTSLAVTEVDTPSGAPGSDAAINLRLGNYAGDTSRTFDGEIDDVRFYDRMLSASEIADIATPSGGGCAATVLDRFTAISYAGSDADPLWASEWNEFGDSGSPTSQDERIEAGTVGFRLRISDNDDGGFGGRGEGVWREVNLAGMSTALLSFKFQRDSLDNADDAGILFVSGDGGANWSPALWRTEGPGTDTSYQQVDVDISAYVASDTRIRFQTGTGNGGGDVVYIDDVTICAN